MKAIVCKAWGGPELLRLEEVPSRHAQDGEVVIDVKAAGVNFPDVLIIEQKYQVRPDLPFTPGCELAGIVKEIGAGVTHVQVGDRVAAFVNWGAFAEECVAASARVVPLPASVDFAAAATFSLAYGTAWHALKDRGQLRPGETLLVLGAAGGVGMAAIDIGKMLGARVIAAASDDAKLQACRERGADEAVNYARDDLRARSREIAGEAGVDVVFDPVGGRHSEPALRALGWRGRLLVVGFADGEIPRLPLNLPLLKGCSIVGVYWGEWLKREAAASRAEMQRLFGYLRDGKLAPFISARYPLVRAPDALAMMKARRLIGKAVVEMAH